MTDYLVIKQDTTIEVKDSVIFVAGKGLYQIEDEGKRDDRFDLLKWFRDCSEIKGRPIVIKWGSTYRERVSHYLNQQFPSYEVSIGDNWFVLQSRFKMFTVENQIRKLKDFVRDIGGEIDD